MATQLLAVKAGRSHRRGSSNFVDPSDTKGEIVITRGDDELLHFQWRNRSSGQVEDDLIIFPSEAEFIRAAGRTYVLKFSSSSQRHFFWFQDISSERDDEYVAHVNGYLADPDYDQSSYVPHATMEEPSSSPEASGSQSAVPGITQQQFDQFKSIVSRVAAQSQPAVDVPDMALTDILTPARLRPLFGNPTLLQAIFPHLPPDLPADAPHSEETLCRIIESPQFQTGVRNLDQALSTGLLAGLVRGLGLPEDAGLGVGPFLNAIAEQAKKSTEGRQDTMETD